MKTTHFNGLTEAEAERLAIMSEECAEVIQVIGKIQRHGYESRHPNGGPNNQELLEMELGHVQCAQRMLLMGGDIKGTSVARSDLEKREKIGLYLHHNTGAT